MNRRNFMLGAGAFATAVLAGTQNHAGAGDGIGWLEKAGFKPYELRGDTQGFSLVYFGTPNRLRDVSCGNDLDVIAYQVEQLRKHNIDVAPVFVFPDDNVRRGSWDNVWDYIDPADSLFSAYHAPFELMRAFAREQMLAEFTLKEGRILRHTQYASLMSPEGEFLHGGPASMDFSQDYAARIQTFCAEHERERACLNAGL